MDSKLQQAIEHREAGRYIEAEQLLNELLREDADNPLVSYHLAWLMDVKGRESAAVSHYERALVLGLPDPEAQGARLGLGSTYRCLGEYDKAEKLLRQSAELYPQAAEFRVFLAMTLYNLQRYAEAMELLLKVVAENPSAEGLQKYGRAILFYADKLDEQWT